ncbi:MAG TPA: hypothetical protein VI248_07815 [Kineosporiaceae bacterium]
MGSMRGSSRQKALGSLAVAAGGFTAGGLVMALSLSVLDGAGRDVRVVLQDDLPAAGRTPAAPVPSAAPTTRTAPHRPAEGTTSAGSTRTTGLPRRVAAPTRVGSTPRRTAATRPPAVRSTGS